MQGEIFKERVADYLCYTCGECNPYKVGGSAYIVVKDGEIVHSSSLSFEGTTENRMELMAIVSAANWLPVDKSMEIHTASDYCVDMLRNKTRPLSSDTKNLTIINAYRKIARDKVVTFRKAKGEMHYKMAKRMAHARMVERVRKNERASYGLT